MISHFGLARQYNDLREELLEATDLAMRDGHLMSGKYTDLFERWLADRTGCQHALVMHSGTQALEAIADYIAEMHYLGGGGIIPKVNVPNLTYPATMNAFLTSGWDVNLVDVDKNGLMKTTEIEFDFDTYNCAVGLYGAPIEPTSQTIIDGAQHWLVADYWVGMGMAISFDPTKNLNSSGNGGAIVTNDPSMYEYAISHRNNGKPDHFRSGTNSKMSELECAHMLVRTNYIDFWQSRRKEIRLYYLDQFKDLPIRCLSRDFKEHADQKFVIYSEFRDELYKYLCNNGIEAKIHYPYALSELPIAKDIEVKPDMLSTSVMLSRGILSLPIYPELLDSEVEIIATCVKDFHGKYH